MNQDFQAKLDSFVAGVSAKVNVHYANCFPSLKPPVFSLDVGSKYVRVVRSDPHKSVFCFVNKENGDVLKAAGWKAPAKHARSNIFNAQNGLDGVGVYGANYL